MPTIVGDMTGMWSEGTSAIASGLAGLGIADTAESMQQIASFASIMEGLGAAITVASTLVELYKSRETAEAAIQTAAATLTGRWWQVAAAAGIAVTVGVSAYAIATKVRSARINASNPSETTLTKKMIGEVV